jgi:hypothetical protein
MQDTERRLSLAALIEACALSSALTLAVSHRFGVPIWEVTPGLLGLGLLTSAAYLIGRVTYGLSRQRGLTRAVSLTAVVCGPLLLALLVLDLSFSRYALIGELALLTSFLAFAAMPVPTSARMWIPLVMLTGAAYPSLAGITGSPEGTSSLSSGEVQYGFTSYHDVSISTFTVLGEEEVRGGGAMTLLPHGRVLLVAGSGESRILEVGEELDVSRIELGLPMDVATYEEQAANPDAVNAWRVTDALYTDGHLLVTYTHWHPEQDCYTLRLLEAEFVGVEVGPWTTRFDAQPCLKASSNQSGGRIAVLGPSEILLTVGSFGGIWGSYADYGKIIRLDRRTWQAQVFTTGHRNPQGLLVSKGRVWSTEHGPQGGDELNLIEAGQDYGWPHVSYGTDYGTKILAEGGTPGDHTGFAPPVYAWTPSIGVSNLIEVSAGVFPLWEGDLLVGSLSGQGNGESLFRLRLLEGRVVNVERLPTGHRVRDLLEVDGGVILWDGNSVVQLVRPVWAVSPVRPSGPTSWSSSGRLRVEDSR